jgi:enoyl-CoA hydratase/carnithine racemase
VTETSAAATLTRTGAVAVITLNRPAALNGAAGTVAAEITAS